jgi:hypothetical protein
MMMMMTKLLFVVDLTMSKRVINGVL